MSVFPTRILLASDASESAAHATKVAAELSKKTHSQLHVLYVGEDAYLAALLYPEVTDSAWVVQEEDLLLIGERGRQQFEQVTRQTLDAEVEKVRAVGGTCAGALENGDASSGDRGPSRGAGGGAGSCREPRFGWDQEGFDGKRL